jgi:hypothetical protein
MATFDEAADVGHLADVLGAVVDDADEPHAYRHGRLPLRLVQLSVQVLGRHSPQVGDRSAMDGLEVVDQHVW